MKKTGRDHLEELGRSKSEMAEGQPNLQNWKVVDHTGQKIGTVYDLLFDKESKKVRYIITNLKNGELLKEERLVLIPVGRARYHDSEQEIVFPNITRDQLSALPDFLTAEDLTQEDERSVRNAFSREDEHETSTADQDRDSFYDHADFDEDIFYNRNAPASKDSALHTTPTTENRKKEDLNQPTVVPDKTDTKTPVTGTTSQKTTPENHKKKDEDVNVHPDPAERSADRSGSSTIGDKDRKTTSADKKNPE